MKRKLLVLVSCAGLFSLPASGQAVFGTTDCGSWVKEATYQRKAWLLGYMSGLSVLHHYEGLIPKNPLDKVSSAEQIFLWVDNYCRANPLARVEKAGLELFKELQRG